MAFDLYVGPVSRYVVGDRQNVDMRRAQAQGVDDRRVRSRARKPPVFWRRRRLERAYRDWPSNLVECLAQYGNPVTMWDDSPSLDYLTDRPGWEGFNGLVVRYASLLRPDLAFPERVPNWLELAENDNVRAVEDDHPLLRTLSYTSTWLPVQLETPIYYGVPGHKYGTVGSVAMLNAALDGVCQLENEDRANLESRPTVQPGPEASVQDAARHGLAVFCRLATEAERRNLPMIVDSSLPSVRLKTR